MKLYVLIIPSRFVRLYLPSVAPKLFFFDMYWRNHEDGTKGMEDSSPFFSFEYTFSLVT